MSNRDKKRRTGPTSSSRASRSKKPRDDEDEDEDKPMDDVLTALEEERKARLALEKRLEDIMQEIRNKAEQEAATGERQSGLSQRELNEMIDRKLAAQANSGTPLVDTNARGIYSSAQAFARDKENWIASADR